MNIALIAHDEKKELMIQFCIAYCGTLSKHSLCATATTGTMVQEAAGLNVFCFNSGKAGGDEQIASRISCSEIDVLFFFRDNVTRREDEPNELNLLRLCDIHFVPYATNIATAEAIIFSIENGDLDWRNDIKPSV